MKKIYLFTIAILLSGFCLGQNTGYMGKHVIFNAEGYLSPSWKNPNPLSRTLDEHINSAHLRRYLGLNYILSPNVECIVWEKGSVGAGYNYYNSPYKGSLYQEFTSPSQGYYFNEDYSFTGQVVAHGFNVFYKQYLGYTKAPLGFYAKFIFDGFFYHYTNNEEPPQWIGYYHPDFKEGKSMLFGAKAEIGYDYLFFNRLRLSFGFSFGSTFGGYKAMKGFLDDYSSHEASTTSVNSFVRNRILNAYWFGLKVGVGFLAF
jgi:hypothetical protein